MSMATVLTRLAAQLGALTLTGGTANVYQGEPETFAFPAIVLNPLSEAPEWTRMDSATHSDDRYTIQLKCLWGYTTDATAFTNRLTDTSTVRNTLLSDDTLGATVTVWEIPKVTRIEYPTVLILDDPVSEPYSGSGLFVYATFFTYTVGVRRTIT